MFELPEMTVNRIIGQQGYTRMSGTPKAAGRPISFWLRDTICLNRGNGAWKIVHLHSSVPFYMDGSLRPAFDLQP